MVMIYFDSGSSSTWWNASQFSCSFLSGWYRMFTSQCSSVGLPLHPYMHPSPFVYFTATRRLIGIASLVTFSITAFAFWGNLFSLCDILGLKRGDLKTLTLCPWTPLRSRSMDYLTDRCRDPFYGATLQTTTKNRRNVEVCKIVDSDEVSWIPGRMPYDPLDTIWLIEQQIECVNFCGSKCLNFRRHKWSVHSNGTGKSNLFVISVYISVYFSAIFCGGP